MESADDCSVAHPPALTKRAVIGMVVRRSRAHLIEATVVPAVLFYCCLVTVGLGAAYLSALSWSYAALVRRLATRQEVPPLLVLGLIGITLKTVVAVVSNSSFLYFFQPILATVAMGCVFFLSVAIGKPLIGRLAGEFWPVTPEMAARPGVDRLFRNLTFLWGAVNFASAALTMSLLLSLPLPAFVAVKQVAGTALSAAAVFVTISLSLRTARREGFVSAPSGHPLPAVHVEARLTEQPALP